MPVDIPTTTPRRSPRAIRCAALALAALVCAAIGAPAVSAADAKYEGISATGGVAFFSTDDSVVPGDTDTKRDIFARSFDPGVGAYVTRQVSTGPSGGNNAFPAQYYGADPSGAKVFFSTEERLTPDDRDSSVDVYMRMRDLVVSTTTLVSKGSASCAAQGCGNGAVNANVVSGGVLPEGSQAFFATGEQLASEDRDNFSDVYLRDLVAGTTTLVSAGDPSCALSDCGNGGFVASFAGASSDGSKVFLTTSEPLSTQDIDVDNDIYARNLGTGTTALVSVAVSCSAGPACNPTYGGASGDGLHAVFETRDRISPQDGDDFQDVYDWSTGTLTLASRGSAPAGGNFHATYEGISQDGATVYFATSEPLDSDDRDLAQDIYERSGGVTTLVSRADASCSVGTCGNGTDPVDFRWISPDGSSSAVVFSTAESLAAGDDDTSQDVYKRAGGATMLLSAGDASCAASMCGNGPFDANFAGASSDGSRVFVVTDEPLIAADSDGSSADVYERFGTTTSLVSRGPAQLPTHGAFGADLAGVSQSGADAFFVIRERLTVDDDFAGELDVYTRSAGETLLVSVGNAEDLRIGPPPPSLTGTSPSSPNESTQPSILGQAETGSAVKIYTSSNCSGEPVAIGTAAELATPGIQVTVGAGTTTSFRATAEADGITSPCSSPISYTQQSATPPPPPPDPGTGSGGGSGSGSGSTGSSNGSSVGIGPSFLIPQTRITFAPGIKTRVRRPVFRFTDETGQEGSIFRCKVDRRDWYGCSSPQRVKRLRWGKHTFRVTATNRAGAPDPGIAKHAFKVVR